MTRRDGPLAVIGLGNVLVADDGIGVRVVRELEQQVDCGETSVPAGTELHDGGTLGLDLLPVIAGARAVLLVDAADLGLSPGTVATVRGDRLRAGAGSWPDALAWRPALDELLVTADVAGILPAEIALVAVQAAGLEDGDDPDAAVLGAVPAAVAATLAELRRMEAAAPALPGRVAAERRPLAGARS